MKQAPKFANLADISLEKQRLQKAIARQERILLKHAEQTKEVTKTELSPINLLKQAFTQFFSFKMLQRNPLTSFNLGYKLIGFIIKKIRSKK